MKKTRSSEQQITGVLKEAEAGAKTADLARRHGISETTIYNWKSKYGGLDVSEARRSPGRRRSQRARVRECEVVAIAGRWPARSGCFDGSFGKKF